MKASDLGRRIAAHRRAAGLTQEELAERAGVNVKTVQGVEQGRTEPELRTMTRFAKALGTSLESLIPVAVSRSVDTIVRRIEADLREIPVPVLEHLAAVVRALAAKK
jgi:transcriptional regulator with XRE-family HTH domain